MALLRDTWRGFTCGDCIGGAGAPADRKPGKPVMSVGKCGVCMGGGGAPGPTDMTSAGLVIPNVNGTAPPTMLMVGLHALPAPEGVFGAVFPLE